MRSGPLFDDFFSGWAYDRDAPRRSELAYSSDEGWQGLVMAAAAEQKYVDCEWFQTRNQGPVGSCRGHSLAGVAEYCHRLAAGNVDLDGDGKDYEAGSVDDRFSPQWCYIETQKIDGLRGDVGSSIGGGIELASTKGIARESVCPYNGRYEPRAIPAEAEADAARFKLRRHDFFQGGDREADARLWLTTGQGPIDIGIRWPPAFDEHFVIRKVTRGRGGHAIFVGGFVQHPVTGEDVYKFYNSHDVNAQDHGKFYMPPAIFAEYLDQDFTMAVGVSDMSVARPRRFDWRKGIY